MWRPFFPPYCTDTFRRKLGSPFSRPILSSICIYSDIASAIPRNVILEHKLIHYFLKRLSLSSPLPTISCVTFNHAPSPSPLPSTIRVLGISSRDLATSRAHSSSSLGRSTCYARRPFRRVPCSRTTPLLSVHVALPLPPLPHHRAASLANTPSHRPKHASALRISRRDVTSGTTVRGHVFRRRAGGRCIAAGECVRDAFTWE